MKIIGITGSVGCGKTYLAGILKNMGYSVYNPDLWVRGLYKQADFLEIIKSEFPDTFENGVFNKRKLRNIVFTDNAQRRRLEKIIHPLLKKKLKYLIHKYSRTNDFLFFDVALLFEMKWDKYCDYVITAYADDKTQIERVMKRDNVSEADVKKIIAAQSSKKEKSDKADCVIDTTLSYGINKAQLIGFIEEI